MKVCLSLAWSGSQGEPIRAGLLPVNSFQACILIWCTYFSLRLIGFLLTSLFNPEYTSDIFLRNVGLLLLNYTALHPRWLNSSLLDWFYYLDVTLVNCVHQACNWPAKPLPWPHSKCYCTNKNWFHQLPAAHTNGNHWTVLNSLLTNRRAIRQAARKFSTKSVPPSKGLSGVTVRHLFELWLETLKFFWKDHIFVINICSLTETKLLHVTSTNVISNINKTVKF